MVTAYSSPHAEHTQLQKFLGRNLVEAIVISNLKLLQTPIGKKKEEEERQTMDLLLTWLYENSNAKSIVIKR